MYNSLRLLKKYQIRIIKTLQQFYKITDINHYMIYISRVYI
jgi:hypothetical protein